MNKIHFVIISLIAIAFLGSCKSKKNLSNTGNNTAVITGKASIEETENTLRLIKQNRNDYDYVKVDAVAAYNDGKNAYDLDVELVCEKDKYIWMKVTAIFGIEAARLLLTPDKIQLLDRLNRKHITANYTYLKNFTDIPLTFVQLQNMIAGNALFDADAKQSNIENAGAEKLLTYLFNQNIQTNIYNTTNYKNRKSIVADTIKNQSLEVDYSDYIANGTNTVPSNISINIKGEKNVACQFKLSNFAFDKKGEVQFSVPKSYQEIQY
jgi:hypothetical protein